MTPVPLRQVAKAYGRCPAFFSAAVRLGMLRATRLCPLTVDAGELQAFVDQLTTDQVRAVNRFLTSKRPREGKPALPAAKGRGRRPGSGFISKIREDRETVRGVGGTDSAAPSGVTR